MIETADWIESNARQCAEACVEGKNFDPSIKYLYNAFNQNLSNVATAKIVFVQ